MIKTGRPEVEMVMLIFGILIQLLLLVSDEIEIVLFLFISDDQMLSLILYRMYSLMAFSVGTI